MSIFKKPSTDLPGIESPSLEGYDDFVKNSGMSKTDTQRLLSVTSIKSDKEIPDEFICPITQDVMTYPVLCCDGFVYEKAAIQEWLISRKKTSPMTNLPMTSTKMDFQKELKDRINEFMKN